MESESRALGGQFVHGRSLTYLVRGLVHIWTTYRSTLAAALPAEVAAALDVLVTAYPVIMAINPPGPG